MSAQSQTSPAQKSSLAQAAAAGREPERAPNLGPAFDRAPNSGLLDPSLVMLPYLEMSRALLRAHHNALAMVEANRLLGDALRAIVRRQQDLAFELAEQAWGDKAGAKAEADPQAREFAFERAADAVREIGQAVIDAQLSALQTLQAKSIEVGDLEKAGKLAAVQRVNGSGAGAASPA